MDHMEIVDVINNLKKWESWDYKSYPISKNEAEAIISFYRLFEKEYQEMKGERDGLDCD